MDLVNAPIGSPAEDVALKKDLRAPIGQVARSPGLHLHDGSDGGEWYVDDPPRFIEPFLRQGIARSSELHGSAPVFRPPAGFVPRFNAPRCVTEPMY
jgi:hypothetical protein